VSARSWRKLPIKLKCASHNPNRGAYADLHLPTLAYVMDGVAGYFSGTDELQGAAP